MEEDKKPGNCEWCGDWYGDMRGGICEPCRNQWNVEIIDLDEKGDGRD